MNLGAFSISLAVKDLKASREFYNKLGFHCPFEDWNEDEHNYVILKNGDHMIGLFQGMFEDNILTFNPGWNQSAEPVDPFDDVRTIRRHLVDEGVELLQEAGFDAESGPASFVVVDPDGNPVLIDQHR